MYEVYSIKNLGNPLLDTLKFDNKNRVTVIEIVLIGEVRGEAVLEFENGSGRFNKIDLKGKVNQTYKTEWYSSKILFKYTPISKIRGDSLKLKYRMY